MSNQSNEIKQKYWEQITPDTHSNKCISCGVCEEHCPQEIPIRRLMKESTYMFPKLE